MQGRRQALPLPSLRKSMGVRMTATAMNVKLPKEIVDESTNFGLLFMTCQIHLEIRRALSSSIRSHFPSVSCRAPPTPRSPPTPTPTNSKIMTMIIDIHFRISSAESAVNQLHANPSMHSHREKYLPNNWLFGFVPCRSPVDHPLSTHLSDTFIRHN